MTNRLKKKVAIITGSASGMGLAGLQLFAKEGAKVVGADLSIDTLKKEVEKLTKNGLDATALKLDVSDPDSWDKLVKNTISKYGKIDILVNNAGIHITKGVLDSSVAEWTKQLAVNETGVWLGMKAVIPYMKKNNGGKGLGSIVNTSSVSSLMGGFADAGSVAYSASKGAVDAMTRHTAQWFAKYNIRANTVNPGPIFTGMAKQAGIKTLEDFGKIHKGKIALPPYAGEPNDIAYAFLYLASDESKFVTGTSLVVDGGWSTNSFEPEDVHGVVK